MKINIKNEGENISEILGINPERINELEQKLFDVMQSLEPGSNIYFEIFTAMNEMDLNLEEIIILSGFLGYIISQFNLFKDEE